MTSSPPCLVPGYKQVESFGPDDDYEDDEEVTYVTLDLGSVEPTLVPSSADYRLIGLDTPTPFLQLSGTIFKGYHDTLLGTELLFSEEKGAAGRSLRHMGSTEQRIRFKEVQLKRKEPQDDQPTEGSIDKGKGKEKASSSTLPTYLARIDSSDLLGRMTGSAVQPAEAEEGDRDDDSLRKARRKGKRKGSQMGKAKSKGKQKANESAFDEGSPEPDADAMDLG